MEGYLHIRKKSNALFDFENFQKRYFILNEGILRFLTKRAGSFIGQIHLSISKVEASQEQPTHFLIDTGTQQYELRSEKASQARQWFNSM